MNSRELKVKREKLKMKGNNSIEKTKMDCGALCVYDTDGIVATRSLDSKSLLPFTQRSDSADRAGCLNKKEQNRQRLAARFCDTLFSKISARKTKKTATKSAPEIFEVCAKLKMQGDRAAFKETKSGAVAHPLDSKSLLPFAQRSDSADRAWRLNKKEQ
ncbi:MAG: hypothetical protein LBH29_06490, partial [Elusimicrobiota bacterium]|nr:hypothetical protein [Elusimicrobiota bacterium]